MLDAVNQFLFVCAPAFQILCYMNQDGTISSFFPYEHGLRCAHYVFLFSLVIGLY